MVDYHNPVTIAQESSAYVFFFLQAPGFVAQSSRSVFLTEKIVDLWHIVDGIFMYVSLPGPYRLDLQLLRDNSIAALRF